MSDFKVIDTQEKLDAAFKSRIARERETIEEKYKDYDQLKARNAELEANISKFGESEKAHEAELEKLNSKIAGYETASLRTKIALQHGIPYDLADRLKGDNEKDLLADAERLGAFVKPKIAAPLKGNEPKGGDGKDGAYKALVQSLDNQGE